MRLLITGAAGFIGANLVKTAHTHGHEVHAVVRPSSDTWRLAGDQFVQHDTDLGSADAVRVLLESVGPDAIINAASHGAYPAQIDLARMLAVNIVAVQSLVDWATEQHIPMVHLGSSSEYGSQSNAPTEFSRVAPNSMYAVTKAAGSHIVCDAAHRRQLRAVVLRLYSVYGPWEDPTRLMPTLAIHALDQRLPPMLVSPDVARDFIHVNDVVEACLSWVQKPIPIPEPAIVNIGSGYQSTLAGVISMAADVCDIDEQPRWQTMPNRAWDMTQWVADTGRVRSLLDWTPRVSLVDGFLELVQFVAEHPERYRTTSTASD